MISLNALIPLVIAIIAALGSGYAVVQNRRSGRDTLTHEAYQDVYKDRVQELKDQIEKQRIEHDREIQALKRAHARRVARLRERIESLESRTDRLENGSN